MELREYCTYRNDRINSDELKTHNYISTENLLPNKGGITEATSIPTGNVVRYDKGNILISNIRPYFKKIWLADKSGGCSADVLCIQSNDKVTSKFLYYLLSQQSFFDYVMAGAKGCKMPRGDKSHIMEWDVNIPDIDEQKRIADFLSSLDDKIELNRQINDNLEQQAQALYLSYFSDTPLCCLGDMVKTASGGTPSRNNLDYYSHSGIDWVKSKELNRSIIFQTEERITNNAINYSSAKVLPKYSTLIAMYGATVGEYGLIAEPMTCNQAICALIPNENYPYTYLFMFAKNVRQELINNAVGSAQQNISQVMIKNMQISRDLDSIKKYDDSVRGIFDSYIHLSKEISYLTELRDTLLPRLMSGELKINEINC